MPAEFEPHAAIWMGWPKEQPYADPALDTRVPIAQIIAALCAHGVAVKLMCTDEAGEREARRWLGAHGHPVSDHLEFVHLDQIDIWVRDYGPIFTRNRENRLGMARFLQNQWGYATTSDPVSRAMTALPERVARHEGIDHVTAVDVVSEGGTGSSTAAAPCSSAGPWSRNGIRRSTRRPWSAPTAPRSA